jgi:three-Cys-motif partner protein
MTRIEGDDGLPASEVGKWVKEKHQYLTCYIGTARSTRAKFIGPGNGGAAYFDLFCGTGRARIRDTGEWVDGSAIAAWNASVVGGAPFSQVFVSDIDPDSVNACAERLCRLDAPVTAIPGGAVEAAQKMVARVGRYGLHLGFLDPYSLGALDFRIIESLARLKRIDLVIHLSAMDLNRNLDSNLGADQSAFDSFAPGWREAVDMDGSQKRIRERVVEYWRQKVPDLGKWPSTNQRLITGERNQPLYWLLLAANHQLAHKFWSTAVNPERQGTLF